MDPLVRSFKALADPVRLRIVDFVSNPVRSCCAQEDAVCACRQADSVTRRDHGGL